MLWHKKKQFLQVENLRQRLKKYVEVSSILNLVATVTQQTSTTNYSSEKYSNPGEYKRNESSHHFSIKVSLLFPPPPLPLPTGLKMIDRSTALLQTFVWWGGGGGGTNLPQSIKFNDFPELKS